MTDQATPSSCRWPGAAADTSGFPEPLRDLPADVDAGELVLGGGCFWCVEAVFARLRGVIATECGYAGGDAATANYTAVCRGDSGHAEVVRIRYAPEEISLGALLKVFFSVAHDPTQWMRQGNDVGPQYRSVIFAQDDAQRAVVEAYIDQLNKAGCHAAPVVTRVESLAAFHPAEAEHQRYAERNPNAGYIRMVSMPKVEKLEARFAAHLTSTS